MNKPHIFSMISPQNSKMFKNIDILYNSIKMFKHKNFKFSIIVPFDEINFIPKKYKKYNYQIYFYKNIFSHENNINIKYKHSPRWFCNPDTDCDLVIFMDHDTIMTKDTIELEKECLKNDSVFGVQAYAPPFKKTNYTWEFLFNKFDIKYPKELFNYSSKKESNLICPFYPNAGFIVFPKNLLFNIQKSITNINNEIFDKIPELLDNYFLQQIVITLAFYKYNIPFKNIDCKYNYADIEFGDIKEDTCVYHYLSNKDLCFTNKTPPKFIEIINLLKKKEIFFN